MGTLFSLAPFLYISVTFFRFCVSFKIVSGVPCLGKKTLHNLNQQLMTMKKIYFPILLFGALLFCACDKDNSDLLIEDQTQLEEGVLKGVSKGHFKVEFYPPLPFWARMGAGATLGIPSTDEYGIIYFYVENPDLWVDRDFNLYNFFHLPGPSGPGPFNPSIPWAIEGDLWFEAGANPDFDVPFMSHYKAKEVVTFYIITREQVEHYFFDVGVFTFQDLMDCDPMVGEAAAFNEVLRPYGPEGLIAPVAGIQTSAKGIIVDGMLDGEEVAKVGTKFNFKYHTKGTDPTEPLEISIVKFNLVGK